MQKLNMYVFLPSRETGILYTCFTSGLKLTDTQYFLWVEPAGAGGGQGGGSLFTFHVIRRAFNEVEEHKEAAANI
jgi:hypothetical protein